MRGRGGRYFSALPPKLEKPPEVTTLAGTLGGATGDPVASVEPEAEQVHPSAHFHSLALMLPS